MQCPSEVLHSIRPSAAFANVVHESNQSNKHKEFTHIQPLVNFSKLKVNRKIQNARKINALLKIHPCDGAKKMHIYIYDVPGI